MIWTKHDTISKFKNLNVYFENLRVWIDDTSSQIYGPAVYLIFFKKKQIESVRS